MAATGPFARRFLSAAVRAGAFGAAMAFIVSCQSEAPTETRLARDVSLAKGGGGGGGGGTGGSGVAPTVSSTSPSFAFQDTTIDVTIVGSDFTNGASAAWSLNGNTSYVQVKSTKFLSATELKVSLVVPASAPVAKYDVIVTLSNGKKGVGAEKFEVLQGDPQAAFWFPLEDEGLGLRSDHQYPNGTSSVYSNGVCGVHSRVFATGQASGSGDAIMHTNNPRYSDRKCAAYPRAVKIVYGPGDEETGPVFINVREIANTTFQIPIGTTVARILRIGDARCDGLAFTPILGNGTDTNGADHVNVTRLDASTWSVETRPYPDNQAYCPATGQLYHIDVRFLVVTDRPLP